MRVSDHFIPPSWRGLVQLVTQHPYWHSKYRQDFGKSIVILNASFQGAVFCYLYFTSEPEMQALWPLLLMPSFIVGSLGALAMCSEVFIVLRFFQGQRRGCRALVLAQLIGLALASGALLSVQPIGSLGSVADGYLLYPFAIGLFVIGIAPLVIWEAVRRNNHEPNHPAEPTPPSRGGSSWR